MKVLLPDHFFERGSERGFDFRVLHEAYAKAIALPVGKETRATSNGSVVIIKKVAADLAVAITGWSRYKKPKVA
ncbi:MAG: hypothetical protein PHE67_05250 [Campylobacterales bacterium]|nr:hypothetical protein [Campylobacterales bacterium]